ncbi:MAG: IPT/TIG domain-containing protein [Methanomicrobiales archaeon]
MVLKKDSILSGWYTIIILLLLMLMVVIPISLYPNLDQVPDDLIDSVVVATEEGSSLPITTKTVAGISQTLSESTSPEIIRVTAYFDSVTIVDLFKTTGVPAVTGITLASGPVAGGTDVTITGSGFTGATGVNFGSIPSLSFSITSDTEIKATSPASTARIVDVTVTTPNGTTAIVAADQFTYSDEIPVPEFPEPVIPAALIIGMLGVVLLIRRARENSSVGRSK